MRKSDTGSIEKIDPTATSLYESPRKALESLVDSYYYWTGKITESSFALSLAVIGANWAVFGSVDKIRQDPWAEASIAVVIGSLGISLLGYWLLGEMVLARIGYGEGNPKRWTLEYQDAQGKDVPWPSTKAIDRVGATFRGLRTLLPIIGGICFLIAFFSPLCKSNPADGTRRPSTLQSQRVDQAEKRSG